MQLSPLQSRLAASAIASCLLVGLYLALFSPRFALAAETEYVPPTIQDALADFDVSIGFEARSPVDPTYEPEFSAFGRDIIGRAAAEASTLKPNEAMPMNVVPGNTQLFMLPIASLPNADTSPAALELRSVSDINGLEEDAAVGESGVTEESEDGRLRRRLAAARTVYISANTCLQPKAVDPSRTTTDPQQLSLYISTSPANKAPGPAADPALQVVVPFDEGAAAYNLSTSEDIYFGVFAPNISSVFSGIYNVEVAASTEGLYYSYDGTKEPDLMWVDSDSRGALLVTHALTDSSDTSMVQRVMSTQPYVIFAMSQNDRNSSGLRKSFCGLRNNALMSTLHDDQVSSRIKSTMITRGPDGHPKQQFHFRELDPGTSYTAVLARKVSLTGSSLSGRQADSSASSSAGGGVVFKETSFVTRAVDDNCQLITSLDFCKDVAYTVPANTNTFPNNTLLAQFYDNFAKEMWKNFEKVLAQIPCDAPAEQRYSLVRNCQDCSNAYKTWLCSVSIPRCMSISEAADWLQPRNINQALPNGTKIDASQLGSSTAFTKSRRPDIDTVVQPGPYKEVLPCEDICYNLTQSCPASMGFSCPTPGDSHFEFSYGRRIVPGVEPNPAVPFCNSPGSALNQTSAATVGRGEPTSMHWILLVPALGIIPLML